MEKIRYLLLLVCSFLCSNVAKSDYTFTMYLDISGSCVGIDGGVAKKAAEAMFNHYANQVKMGIPDRSQCEQFRSIIQNEIIENYDGCRIRVICGPCTGSGDGVGGAPSANIQGPANGGSFFSANAANEVRDWDANADRLKQMLTGGTSSSLMPTDTWTASIYQDAEEWMSAGGGATKEDELRSGSLSNAKFFTIDTSKAFTSLNMRDDRGMMPIAREPYVDYVKFDGLLTLNSNYNRVELELRKMFAEECGLMLTELEELKKKPQDQLTENEEMILAYYNLYMDNAWAYMEEQAVYSEGKAEVDATVLSYATYYDAEQKNSKQYNELLSQIGYKRIEANQIPFDDPMYEIAKLVLQKNLDGYSDDNGFRAQLFKNEETGQYTLAVEGTDDMFLTSHMGSQDRMTDLITGLLREDSKQFQAALEIGQAIANLPAGVVVNITGHSLGGALASIIGLVSGSPTITVNAMGVPKSWLEKNGLSERYNKHDYNIKALISADDILNTLQKFGEHANLGPGGALGDQKILGKSTVINALNECANSGLFVTKEALESAAKGAVEGTILGGLTGGPVGMVPGAISGAQKGAIKGAVKSTFKIIKQEIDDPKILTQTGVSWHGAEPVALYTVAHNSVALGKWNNWRSINKQRKEANKKTKE